MLRSDIRPNVRTYTALIAALGAGGQWERALEVVQVRAAGASGWVCRTGAEGCLRAVRMLRALACLPLTPTCVPWVPPAHPPSLHPAAHAPPRLRGRHRA